MPIRIASRNIYTRLLALLLFQFLLLPKLCMPLKALCVFSAVSIVFMHKKRKLIIAKNCNVLFLYCAWNVFSMFHGMTKGYYDVALRTSTINIIWPLCYLIMSAYPLREQEIKWIKNTLIYLTLILSVSDMLILISILFNINWIIDFFDIFNLNPIRASFSVMEHANLRVDHAYLYAFTVPYLLGLCMYNNSSKNGNKKNSNKNGNGYSIDTKILLPTTILSTIVGVLLGVGGIWLGIFSGAVLCFYKFVLKRMNFRLFAILISFVLVFFLLFTFSKSVNTHVNYIYDEVYGRLFENSDPSDLVRKNQRMAMIEKWIEHPIIGDGAGSPVAYVRGGMFYKSAANESSYHIILYQKGILGFILFFAVVHNSLKNLKKMRNARDFSLSFGIGMISFLISNAFNPYLANISTSWILFLPFMLKEESSIVISNYREQIFKTK